MDKLTLATSYFVALLQSLEDNFTLAVTMFIIGFIATCTIVVFIIVMHRRVHHSEENSGGRADGRQEKSEGPNREGSE